MHHSIWKLTALAVVVGIGALVVVQAQRGFNQREQESQDDDSTAALPEESDDQGTGDGAETPPSQSEPELSLESFGGDEGLPVPAEAKIAGSRQPKIRPAPKTRAVDLASQSNSDDPFVEPPPRKSTAGREVRGDADHVAPALRLNPLDDDEAADNSAESDTGGADSEPRPRLLGDRATTDMKPVEAT
ncbi:MAG TPA: hypothetical protein VL475_07105, partial [Planctomycetaceae bacterium]|nr:hypothetical protein [Planctomycetaceae bacterium]